METPFLDSKVRQFIEEAAGPEGIRIAELLVSRDEATDTQLAEELGQKPSHIRKVLYNLYEARVAEYHKEKDKETGWLTFFWRISRDQAQGAVAQKIQRDLGELENRLQYEQEHDFFVCPTGHERFEFGQATEASFHCPEHGDVLEAYDNATDLENLRDRIKALREVMGS